MIPKEIRDALGLAPGDSVAFRLDGDGVRVTRVDLLETLRGRFLGGRLAEELGLEHRHELENEERRIRRSRR